MDSSLNRQEIHQATSVVSRTTSNRSDVSMVVEAANELVALPVELITRVMTFLCSRDRVRLAQVCRRLLDIYNNEPVGAYAVESDLANVKNGPAANFTTADRLARLREYRACWRTLQWTGEIRLDLSQEYELRLNGSVLARCSMTAATTLFEFMQVPSAARNIPQRDWAVDLPGLKCSAYEIDSAQNLLVVMERLVGNNPQGPGILRMHFLTLDAGFRHPLAERQVADLRVPLPGTEAAGWSVHQVNICDEHIGVMLIYEDDAFFCEFWIWNWQRGVPVMNLHSGYHNVSEGFTFLSPGVILLPMIVPAEDSLHGALGVLAIFDCLLPIPDRISFAMAMVQFSTSVFQLPEPAEGNFYHRIQLGASSCSSTPEYPSPYTHLDNDVPFFADTRTRLFVFDIMVYDPETDGVRGHTLLVPSSTFVRRYRTADRIPFERGQRPLFHWRTWIKEARLTTEALLQSHTSIFQRRCIAADYSFDDEDNRRRLRVALYEISSKAAMRREIYQAPETSWQYVLTPYIDNDRDAWQEAVVTKLPYRKFVSGLDAEHCDLHLGEDCLIIRSKTSNRCRILTF